MRHARQNGTGSMRAGTKYGSRTNGITVRLGLCKVGSNPVTTALHLRVRTFLVLLRIVQSGKHKQSDMATRMEKFL